MIRIAITAEAFDAVAAMLPSGNVLYERERTAHGGYFVWLDESVVNNLKRLRGPRDEDLSAVIVRLFGEQSDEQIAELLRGEQGREWAFAAIAGNVEPTKDANAIDRPSPRETRLSPRALAALDWQRRAERLGLHYRKLNPP